MGNYILWIYLSTTPPMVSTMTFGNLLACGGAQLAILDKLVDIGVDSRSVCLKKK